MVSQLQRLVFLVPLLTACDDASVTSTDPCEGQTCSGHGICAVVDGITAVCVCNDGYRKRELACVPTTQEPACINPTAEVCDGLDNDCDTEIDEGACAACRCDDWGTTDNLTTIPTSRNQAGSIRSRIFEVAFDGNETLAFLSTGDDEGASNSQVWLSLRRTDGSTVTDDVLLASGLSGTRLVGVSWAADRWVVGWRREDLSSGQKASELAAVDSTGTLLAGPVSHSNVDLRALATAGGSIYGVYDGDAAGLVQRYDAALTPVGSPIQLPSQQMTWDARGFGDTVAVIGVGAPGTTYVVSLLRQGALLGEVPLMQTSLTPTTYGLGLAALAADADGIVGCFLWAGGIWCRYVSANEPVALGPAFSASLTATVAWDVARASCSMALMTGEQWSSGSAGRYVMNHFDRDHGSATKTVDRQWLQPRPALRLLSSPDGRLVRVLDANTAIAAGQRPVLITTMSCREPPAPVTDCAQLAGPYCDQACDTAAVCEDWGPSECTVVQGTGSMVGFNAADCLTTFAPSCDNIDAERCLERLQQPPVCDAAGWHVPADCVIAR